MNVGIITPRFPPNHEGGGEVSARLLARKLSSSNEINSVTVYSFDGGASTGCNGYSVVRYNSPSHHSFEVINSYAYFKLRSRFAEDRLDVIHSYNMQLHPVVGHLSSQLEIPSVATLNSYAYIPYQKIDVPVSNLLEWYKRISWATTGPILRNRMRHIDTFVALSSTVEEIYRETMFPNQRIRVIPNMCEPDMFDAAVDGGTNEIMSDDSTFDVVYVGSLRETKGVEYLIRAADHLPDKYRITIAGGGSNEAELRQLAERFGVAGQVTFLGYVSHERINKLYARANLFVHPGIWPEPFGRTILEAMQFGLPVIATNIGGPAEVIPQEECLCKPGDPVALAETIQFVSRSSAEIGSHNSKYVRQTYSPDAVLPQLLAMYESLNK